MQLSGWLAFAALGIVWGLPYFFIKLAVAEVPPVVIAFVRVTLAAAVLLPLSWRRGAFVRLGHNKGALFAFALVEFVVPFTAIAIGERWIDSSVTGILIAMVPLSIALMQRFFGISERLGAARTGGLVLGLIGVATLVGAGPITGTQGWLGCACMVLATLGYASGPLIILRYLPDTDSLGALSVSLVMAAAVLALPALLQWPHAWPSATALLSITVLGIVCTAIAMLLMFYLVRHIGASRAAVVTYINPLVATLLGVLLLDERLGLGGYLSFALILLGSWLATRGSAATR